MTSRPHACARALAPPQRGAVRNGGRGGSAEGARSVRVQGRVYSCKDLGFDEAGRKNSTKRGTGGQLHKKTHIVFCSPRCVIISVIPTAKIEVEIREK